MGRCIVARADDWQSINVIRAPCYFWNKPLQRLHYGFICSTAEIRTLLMPLQSRVTEHPQPSVYDNEPMWQHPHHCIPMLINSKVAWPANINMLPSGLSLPKLPAFNSSVCAHSHVLPYNLNVFCPLYIIIRVLIKYKADHYLVHLKLAKYINIT